VTGEGSTTILARIGEDEAASIVGYLNGFFFRGEEMEDAVGQQE
jgi:hypothetical protein